MSWQLEIEHGYELYRQGDHRATLAHFARLRDAYPEVAQVWNESGAMYDRMGEEEQAAPLYERALALGLAGEELLDCLICLGSTYRNISRIEDAVRCLEEAQRLEPGNLAVRAFLSLALVEAGRGVEAVQILGQTLLQESQDANLQRYARALGTYFAASGKQSENG
ncbi:hypothetical protein CIG75_20475 [Tumebacillus algifaecis]|uniref:Tetratrico peptide repeat group 5 domain-containing protein n=1 Tax=Tumebacillus algifaecis TaxID=1214604 RepID=A0A223D620_9BACL|nr:tetratricopeptide repeat protein [Tumebacillus algifaecis]ASS77042.1 hypothetical protein CIG75_20475 [Tumebacillus algifaecis]